MHPLVRPLARPAAAAILLAIMVAPAVSRPAQPPAHRAGSPVGEPGMPAVPPGALRIVKVAWHKGRAAICAEEPGAAVERAGRSIRRTRVWVRDGTSDGQLGLGPGACDPAWSPDGRRLAVVTPDGLWVLSADLRRTTHLVDVRPHGRAARRLRAPHARRAGVGAGRFGAGVRGHQRPDRLGGGGRRAHRGAPLRIGSGHLRVRVGSRFPLVALGNPRGSAPVSRRALGTDTEESPMSSNISRFVLSMLLLSFGVAGSAGAQETGALDTRAIVEYLADDELRGASDRFSRHPHGGRLHHRAARGHRRRAAAGDRRLPASILLHGGGVGHRHRAPHRSHRRGAHSPAGW